MDTNKDNNTTASKKDKQKAAALDLLPTGNALKKAVVASDESHANTKNDINWRKTLKNIRTASKAVESISSDIAEATKHWKLDFMPDVQ